MPVMNDITLRNRQFGPEAAMQLVEQRAPSGFDRIDDVITQEEIKGVVASFSSAAGLDVETVSFSVFCVFTRPGSFSTGTRPAAGPTMSDMPLIAT
jgi:hypothetical protein